MSRAAAALLFLVACTKSVPTPPPARMAPDFTLEDSDGQQVTLSKLRARGPVILAFFPKAFTGG